MIGLDTNVLVRYLAQDEPKQSALATRLIEQDLSAAQPGFISLIVLVEMCWVLKRLYAATDDELRDTIAELLDSSQFHIEHRQVVQQALHSLATSKTTQAALPDHLIARLAQHEGCTHTVSFDKAAVRSAGMVLLA